MLLSFNAKLLGFDQCSDQGCDQSNKSCRSFTWSCYLKFSLRIPDTNIKSCLLLAALALEITATILAQADFALFAFGHHAS